MPSAGFSLDSEVEHYGGPVVKATGQLRNVLGIVMILTAVVVGAQLAGLDVLQRMREALASYAPDLADPDPEWTVNLGGPATAAAVSEDRVIAVIRGRVEARDRSNGEEVWARSVDWAVPAGEFVVVGRTEGAGFEVLTATDGETLWSETEAIDSWVFLDLIVQLDCDGGEDGACVLAGRSLSDGEVLWERSLPYGAQAELAGYGELTGVGDLAETVAYTVSVPEVIGVRLDGTVYAVDSATGERLATAETRDEQVRISVLDGHMIRVETSAGDEECRYTLQAEADGDRLWRHRGDYDPHTASGSSCQLRREPAGDSGAIAVTRDDGRPALLDVHTGQERWTGEDGERLLAIGAGLAVVETGDELRVIRLSDAEQLWTYQPGGEVQATATPSAVILQDLAAQRVIALDRDSGDELADLDTDADVVGIGPDGLILARARTIGYVRW